MNDCKFCQRGWRCESYQLVVRADNQERTALLIDIQCCWRGWMCEVVKRADNQEQTALLNDSVMLKGFEVRVMLAGSESRQLGADLSVE